jgi:hypothetical protein
LSGTIDGSNAFGFGGLSHHNGVDSVHVVYVPGPHSLDSATLHLKFSVCCREIDTDIALYGRGIENTKLSISPRAYRLSATRCSFLDTALVIQDSGACPITLLSASIDGSNAFGFGGLSHRNGVDSVHVLYVPGPHLLDSATLHLKFSLCCVEIDTNIVLYGRGIETPAFSLPSALSLGNIPACSTKDTLFTLRNLSCDTLTITGASLGDPLHFRLGPLGLPVQIAPSEFIAIHVLGSGSSAGTYHDILTLHLRCGIVNVDTLVNVSLQVVQNQQIVFPTLSLTMNGACHTLDTSLLIANQLCDSIVFTSVQLVDSSRFHAKLPGLPFILGAGDTLRIPVFAIAGSLGTHTATLRLQYQLRGIQHDTTLTLTEFVQQPPITLALAQTLFDFGMLIAPCDAKSLYLHFTNPLCDSVQIDGAALLSVDTEYALNAGTLPRSLSSHAADSLLLHFRPNRTGPRSVQLKITYEVHGEKHDTLITLAGVGTSSFRDTMLNSQMSFDTVRECESRLLFAQFINRSCANLIVEAASVAGNNGFKTSATIFPNTLRPGDTGRVAVGFVPRNTGSVSDSVIIQLRSPGDTALHLEWVHVVGYGSPSKPALVLGSTSISLDSLSTCRTFDTTLLLRNASSCDSLVIERGVVAGDTALWLDSSNRFPIRLGPSDSVRVVLHIQARAGETLASVIHFSSAGRTHDWSAFDTTISFRYTGIAGGKHLALDLQDSNFASRPCSFVTRQLELVNDGCDSLTIESLGLSGSQTQFSMIDSLIHPLTLRPGDRKSFAIQYTPGSSGRDSTSLHIKTSTDTRTIILHGSAQRPPIARFALSASDGTAADSSAPTTSVALLLTAIDPIPDSLALKTFFCVFHYDKNILNFLNANPAAGWRVLSASETTPGVASVRLAWAGGTVTARSPIATCEFYVSVGDSAGSDIRLSGIRLNDADASYEGCTIQSVATPDLARFTLADDCTSPILRSSLDGNPLITMISAIPNPVRSSVDFRYKLSQATDVSLSIYNALGECVAALISQTARAGTQNLDWDGLGRSGTAVPQGIYYYRIQAGGRIVSGGLAVMR